MLNSQGVCRDTLRRPERIRECPHRKIQRAAVARRREVLRRGSG